MKIAATTLGETGGDAVSMSMNLGYLVETVIFSAIFLIAVAAQIKAKGFHPFLYGIILQKKVRLIMLQVRGNLLSKEGTPWTSKSCKSSFQTKLRAGCSLNL